MIAFCHLLHPIIMTSTTASRKTKTFPEPIVISNSEAEDSKAEESGSDDGVGRSDSDDRSEDDGSESDDSPEAETLSGGRAAADARAGALRKHEDRLNELRKSKNKAREAFIQSTKLTVSPAVDDEQDRPIMDANGDAEESEEEDGDKQADEPPRSDRLPDSIFAAAHETVERKRGKKLSKEEVVTKRRRVREEPGEKVINGRTLRVTTDLNAPPPISSSVFTRKTKSSAKGGLEFRKKWKKVDALRAQVRSRTGPPRNFVTTVQ
ncbi:hypothetical protein RSOLAG1IB_09313 [Rhizoctonia solani AG-1 IB]|uniref:Uncharacterized protein n=1 Tax=Thanatephorus cucumeris (strain AG1-IB / isolate 7/3/14) TaxID=1108050 RepID=A0A0B7FQX5_THACB|nr:hypothetical protein RSOLAG1IB_09313 [Rhizoctonia solani AG-1 IB]